MYAVVTLTHGKKIDMISKIIVYSQASTKHQAPSTKQQLLSNFIMVKNVYIALDLGYSVQWMTKTKGLIDDKYLSRLECNWYQVMLVCTKTLQSEDMVTVMGYSDSMKNAITLLPSTRWGDLDDDDLEAVRMRAETAISIYGYSNMWKCIQDICMMMSLTKKMSPDDTFYVWVAANSDDFESTEDFQRKRGETAIVPDMIRRMNRVIVPYKNAIQFMFQLHGTFCENKNVTMLYNANSVVVSDYDDTDVMNRVFMHNMRWMQGLVKA